MEYVSRHTTIPIPKVYDYWEDGNRTYLVMEYIEGDRLDSIWRSLTDPQKDTVKRIVRGYIDQLRAIPQPDHLKGWISTVSGGPGAEYRFSKFLQPFKSLPEFHDWRAVDSLSEFGAQSEDTAHRLQELRAMMRDDSRVVLTHSDIQKRNILVKVNGDGPEDIKVVALLDWEQCGWRPEYWEKVKMSSPYDGNTWKEILPGYEHEYAIEVELLLISGPPL